MTWDVSGRYITPQEGILLKLLAVPMTALELADAAAGMSEHLAPGSERIAARALADSGAHGVLSRLRGLQRDGIALETEQDDLDEVEQLWFRT